MKKKTIWDVDLDGLFRKIVEETWGYQLIQYEIDGVMYKFAITLQGKEKPKK